jgi:hypothetical protein
MHGLDRAAPIPKIPCSIPTGVRKFLLNGPPGTSWRARAGKPLRLINLGLSIVDVRDLASAHVAALTH